MMYEHRPHPCIQPPSLAINFCECTGVLFGDTSICDSVTVVLSLSLWIVDDSCCPPLSMNASQASSRSSLLDAKGSSRTIKTWSSWYRKSGEPPLTYIHLALFKFQMSFMARFIRGWLHDDCREEAALVSQNIKCFLEGDPGCVFLISYLLRL